MTARSTSFAARAVALAAVLALLVPAAASAQAGTSYLIPPDNPFVGRAGARPEIFSYGLRNPYRFSFDRANGDLLIGDVGQGAREELNWTTLAAARGANFGWPCFEGKIAGPGGPRCPVTGVIGPLADYSTAGRRRRDRRVRGARPGPHRPRGPLPLLRLLRRGGAFARTQPRGPGRPHHGPDDRLAAAGLVRPGRGRASLRRRPEPRQPVPADRREHAGHAWRERSSPADTRSPPT